MELAVGRFLRAHQAVQAVQAVQLRAAQAAQLRATAGRLPAGLMANSVAGRCAAPTRDAADRLRAAGASPQPAVNIARTSV